MNVQVKVCGITLQEDAQLVCDLGFEWIGFNFYSKSARYLNHLVPFTQKGVKRVGVFVNSPVEKIHRIFNTAGLHVIQLHGDETPQQCRQVRAFCPVMKAFGLFDGFDFDQLSEYAATADYFLFDTRSDQYGGSGKKFDWLLLEQYTGDVPFLLSGGIRLEDLPALGNLHHPAFMGIDVNSGFESAPGRKNHELLTQLSKLR